MALALENARLLEDSQRRASKERVIGEVTTKISQSINLRNVLQTAVEELGRVMPGSDVVIQLQSSNDGQRESCIMKNRQLIPEILFAAITKSAPGKGALSLFPRR